MFRPQNQKFPTCFYPVSFDKDVNLLGDTIDTIEKITGTLTDASKEVGLEVKTEKTTYMLLSRYQIAGEIMT
jgi:hypothetical protein